MSDTLADKKCVVTGGASGIGRATAKLLAKHGASVVIADHDEEKGSQTASDLSRDGRSVAFQKLDVTSEESWLELESKALGDAALDALVNNAGISISKSITDLSLDEWHKVLATNLSGAFLGTRMAMRRMNQGGCIVNIASVSGMRPGGGASAYCASKAAVSMFSKCAAIECADANSGIRVNTITPGGVRTPMWEKEEFFQRMKEELGSSEAAIRAMEGDTLSNRFYSAEEVAETVLYLVSPQAAHVSGAEIVLARGHV